MSSRLLDSLATTDALAAVFSDAAVLRAMLDFEGALARGAAAAGVIPAAAARTISDAAREEGFDAASIASAAPAGATPAIPLVKALRARVESVDAASAVYVHWGATSQDVTDTALILLVRAARGSVVADHQRLERALRQISERHASTVMLGRTLLQPATPVTFGLKAAGWAASIARSWRRLERAWADALVIQFGGAAGTLAALGDHGPRVAAETARELDLRAVPPWHTDRDRLGALLTACGLYVAALGKTARDIALLMQMEVAEAAEPGGGSSTMPHKQNPSGCAVVLAAAARLPSLVAGYLTAMIQEHERGAGGIQAEWPIVSAAVQATGAAASSLAAAIEGLTVDAARMRRNLESTGGAIYAERALVLLAPSLGRDAAQRLIADALARSQESGQAFASILRSAAAASVPAGTLDEIDRPERYLGAAEEIRRRLLSEFGE
jgi:3-carboxy-cis,cis-muconate cycloisomerase